MRARLRTLSKDNAEDVGRHLVMAGLMMGVDAETAYRHALVAVARGGRVDVTREALGLTAFQTGRYAEALREFRTVRRLNGTHDYLPQMAACERALGRPEKAIEMAREASNSLPADLKAELKLVEIHARMDVGDLVTAEAMLSQLTPVVPEQAAKREALLAVIVALNQEGSSTTERIDELLTELEAQADAHEDETEPRETIADEVLVYDTQELDEAEVQYLPNEDDAMSIAKPHVDPDEDAALVADGEDGVKNDHRREADSPETVGVVLTEDPPAADPTSDGDGPTEEERV